MCVCSCERERESERERTCVSVLACVRACARACLCAWLCFVFSSLDNAAPITGTNGHTVEGRQRKTLKNHADDFCILLQHELCDVQKSTKH